MLKVLVVVASCLLSLATQAQTTIPPAAAPPAAAPVAGSVIEMSAGRRDTLAALGNLYERRRKGGKVWLGIAGGGLLSLLRVVASSDTGNGVQTEVDGSAVALIGGLFVGLPGVFGFSKLARFSEAAEQEADRTYRGGQPLPRSLRAALSKKDFE